MFYYECGSFRSVAEVPVVHMSHIHLQRVMQCGAHTGICLDSVLIRSGPGPWGLVHNRLLHSPVYGGGIHV